MSAEFLFYVPLVPWRLQPGMRAGVAAARSASACGSADDAFDLVARHGGRANRWLALTGTGSPVVAS